METKTKVMMACAIALGLGFMSEARTIEIKQLKSTGSKTDAEYWWQGTEKSKSSWFQIKIGGASQIDDTSEMEIRAATVFKGAKDKKTGINDVATFEFDPINKGKAIFFMVSTGSAFSREREREWWYSNNKNLDSGWQLAGCIIEIWQKGKIVKHWSNVAGKDGKTKLTDDIRKLRINRDGHPSVGERYYSARDFDNATEIYSVDQKGERVDIDEVLKPFRENETTSKQATKSNDASAAKPSVKNTVAPKLRTCEFLLNKKFKKNAKVYLCLFSASWCGPCRAEMPRIAKTYAETLKDDPDIELIHFSRDQNDEKAMAWAKEHDVKFPVVKPKGGNPLDLHTRGIPHLFIVKADGTLVEEGHPMRIFNEEKFREIKGGNYVASAKLQNEKPDRKTATGEQTETIDGYTWTFRVSNGEATIMSKKKGRRSFCAVSPKPTGNLVIPSVLGGAKVTNIGRNAFFKCHGLTSVTIPDGVTSIGKSAFSQCSGLTSVTIPSSVTSLGEYSFNNCRGLLKFVVEDGNPAYCSVDGVLYNKDRTSLIQYPCAKAGTLKIPVSVTSIGHGALLGCRGLLAIDVEECSPAYCSVDGILYNKERTKLIQCPGGKSGAVMIPSSVTDIGGMAFLSCEGLLSVTIPSSVMSIGGEAFSCCRGLTSVTMSGERPEAKKKVFYKCDKLAAIHVPANAKSWAGMKEWQGIPLVFDAEAK